MQLLWLWCHAPQPHAQVSSFDCVFGRIDREHAEQDRQISGSTSLERNDASDLCGLSGRERKSAAVESGADAETWQAASIFSTAAPQAALFVVLQASRHPSWYGESKLAATRGTEWLV